MSQEEFRRHSMGVIPTHQRKLVRKFEVRCRRCAETQQRNASPPRLN